MNRVPTKWMRWTDDPGQLSDITEKTALVPVLHALSILVNAHMPVVFIDQHRHVSSRAGILIDQHVYRHRRDRSVQRLHRRLFNILSGHISPLYQLLSNHLVWMPLTGNLNRIDAVKALQTQGV